MDRYPKMVTPVKSKGKDNHKLLTPRLTRSSTRSGSKQVMETPLERVSSKRKRSVEELEPKVSESKRRHSLRNENRAKSDVDAKKSLSPRVSRSNSGPQHKQSAGLDKEPQMDMGLRRSPRTRKRSLQERTNVDVVVKKRCKSMGDCLVNNGTQQTENISKDCNTKGNIKSDRTGEPEKSIPKGTKCTPEKKRQSPTKRQPSQSAVKGTEDPVESGNSNKETKFSPVKKHATPEKIVSPKHPKASPVKKTPTKAMVQSPEEVKASLVKKIPTPTKAKVQASPEKTISPKQASPVEKAPSPTKTPPSALKNTTSNRTPGSSAKKVTYKETEQSEAQESKSPEESGPSPKTDVARDSESDPEASSSNKYWATGSSPKSPRGKSKRVSKRRSSFVSGRISRTMPGLSSEEICQEIPEDLSPEERLERLHNVTLEYTLSKMASEFPDMEELQQFSVEVRDAACTETNRLLKEGHFHKVATKLLSQPNPVNELTEKNIAVMEADLARLQREKGEWESILEEKHNAADQAERIAKEMRVQHVSCPPSNLSPAQQAVLNSRPDYNAKLARLKELHDGATIAVDTIVNTASLLERFTSTAQTIINERTAVLYERTFPPDVRVSPRKLLESRLAIPDSPPTRRKTSRSAES